MISICVGGYASKRSMEKPLQWAISRARRGVPIDVEQDIAINYVAEMLIIEQFIDSFILYPTDVEADLFKLMSERLKMLSEPLLKWDSTSLLTPVWPTKIKVMKDLLEDNSQTKSEQCVQVIKQLRPTVKTIRSFFKGLCHPELKAGESKYLLKILVTFLPYCDGSTIQINMDDEIKQEEIDAMKWQDGSKIYNWIDILQNEFQTNIYNLNLRKQNDSKDSLNVFEFLENTLQQSDPLWRRHLNDWLKFVYTPKLNIKAPEIKKKPVRKTPETVRKAPETNKPEEKKQQIIDAADLIGDSSFIEGFYNKLVLYEYD